MASIGLRSSVTTRAITLRPSRSRFVPLYPRQLYSTQYGFTPSPSRWSPDSTKSSSSSSSGSSASNSDESISSSASSTPQGSKLNVFSSEWEDLDTKIKTFEDLPHRLFGANQHMIINYELKEALRLMLRNFNAPIVYCFAYGSGVFPQGPSKTSITESEFRAVHPNPPEALIKSQKGSPKVLDFIFGVSHVEHWHSINMKQNRHHYSGLASLGSGSVSRVQNWGAGVYFNPFVEVNGMLIKYGVTSIDNLVQDLSSWDSLYLAGRLQKPVKILRDHPRVRLANQHNLIAAVRTALLLLPPDFTEAQLYSTIAGLSYLGDPRMSLPTENKSKVTNIVENNIVHFRRLYAPLIKTLPNVDFTGASPIDDSNWIMNPEPSNDLKQDMDPVRRGNMVRRLPQTFRSRLYFQYQKRFGIPRGEFNELMKATSDQEGGVKKMQGGDFERRIATDDAQKLHETVRFVIKQTVNWPSTVQSVKGLLMGGVSRTWRYLGEKYSKWKKDQASKNSKGASEKSK
ncbi:proline transporter [Fusarium heterosporum]|uniref:Phosphatidate cytidylyltransferase, mitochondrial n=1 Tax=Fusarium heterosporum TaxID=42747 RepID=A0A8H5WGA7_FUSHE|nr:proline transporter [Fusarium heterosporum]